MSHRLANRCSLELANYLNISALGHVAVLGSIEMIGLRDCCRMLVCTPDVDEVEGAFSSLPHIHTDKYS